MLQNNETFQIVSRILRTMDVLGGYATLHGRCYRTNESIRRKGDLGQHGRGATAQTAATVRENGIKISSVLCQSTG